jgi:teichuronic acid exporter
MKQVTRKQFISGTIWKLMETVASAGITTVVSIVLARLLAPKDFGIIALTTIFITFSDILVQSGFTTALIRKKEVDDIDYSTALYFAMIIAAAQYLIFYLVAPVISDYYNEPLLRDVLRVLTLVLFLNALASVRTAMINRNLNFKLLLTSNLISGILSGGIGIWMAFAGYGIWALVTQKLVQQFLLTVILFSRLKWRPKLTFSWSRAKSLLLFGSKVLGSAIVAFFNDSLFSIVIGKVYSSRDLGFYDKGAQLPKAIAINMGNGISNVLLPTLASYQDEQLRMKNIMRRVIAVSYYVLLPMLTALVIMARPVIIFLFTEKWLPTVPLMQLQCVYFATIPLLLNCGQVAYAAGKSGIVMRMEVAKMILLIIALILTLLFFKSNVLVLTGSRAVVSLLIVILYARYTKKLVDYSLREQLADIGAPLLLCIGMSACIWCVSLIHLPVSVMVLLQTMTGTATYFALSILFKVKAYHEVVAIMKNLLYRRKNLEADPG